MSPDLTFNNEMIVVHTILFHLFYLRTARLYVRKLHDYTPCIMTLPLHNHSFVVSVRTLHVLKRTLNERCTVPTPRGELCASGLGLLPYLS